MTAKGPALSLDIVINDPRWRDQGLSLKPLSAKALRAAVKRMGKGGEVAVLFTSDAEMRQLNSRWRGKDKATDVLSFADDSQVFPVEIKRLGDIALGLETVLKDAEKLSRPMEAHVSHLLVHGFLHLVGYDHIRDVDAAVMEPLEVEILASLGWPDPYVVGQNPVGKAR